MLYAVLDTLYVTIALRCGRGKGKAAVVRFMGVRFAKERSKRDGKEGLKCGGSEKRVEVQTRNREVCVKVYILWCGSLALLERC